MSKDAANQKYVTYGKTVAHNECDTA